ncbi:hypothetical protein AYO44_12995 [Planctomycetaceae bacterium SCGC AG-212-F19]|nr:hypothetical protein AYO44_12995 [Planctomycetaceae bacterium SCGC AG-212-F19]
MAYQEAQRLHLDYIGTEHLLVGVLNEGSASLGQLLTACGVDPQEIHQKVGFLIPSGSELPEWNQLPLTPSAKRALAYAQEEAGLLKHSWVFPEHILLALLRETDSTAAFVLMNLGLTRPGLSGELARLPVPQNRDEVLQPKAPAGPVLADPSSGDLDLAVSRAVLPDNASLREIPWNEESAFDLAKRGRRPDDLRLPAPARNLAPDQMQFLALKIAVGSLGGGLFGWMIGGFGAVGLGMFAGAAVAFIRNSIVTGVLGCTVGACIGAFVYERNNLEGAIVGGFVGLVLGLCMGEWRGPRRAPGSGANLPTDRDSSR